MILSVQSTIHRGKHPDLTSNAVESYYIFVFFSLSSVKPRVLRIFKIQRTDLPAYHSCGLKSFLFACFGPCLGAWLALPGLMATWDRFLVASRVSLLASTPQIVSEFAYCKTLPALMFGKIWWNAKREDRISGWIFGSIFGRPGGPPGCRVTTSNVACWRRPLALGRHPCDEKCET
jgi:hypothetical protein